MNSSLRVFCFQWAAGVVACFSAGAAPSVVNYVHPLADVGSWTNDPKRPFQLVTAGINSLPPTGGVVRIAPGTYREAWLNRITRPDRLEMGGLDVDAGTARLQVQSGAAQETPFRIKTWNVRLFPALLDALEPYLFGASDKGWFDGQRALYVGDAINGARLSGVDVVAVDEAWGAQAPPPPHPAILTEYDFNFTNLLAHSGYPNALYGGAVTMSNVLNSGLGLLSLHPLMAPASVTFPDTECTGGDCMASKGFIAADIVKEGILIRVFSTHLQAEADGTADTVARSNQLMRIAAGIGSSVDAFRRAQPSGVAFVVGDMNIIGESNGQEDTEYQSFRAAFAALGGKDAVRHKPSGALFTNYVAETTSRPSENNLTAYYCAGCPDKRLDYIFYFSSRDGKVIVQPQDTMVFSRVKGPTFRDDSFASDELSDHYGLEGAFKLFRYP